MRIEFDAPVDFERIKCDICGKEDDDWHVMHFLADGLWRKLIRGQTLREQGIDEQDSSRLYCIHACTEAVIRTFTSIQEVERFMASLRGR